MIFQVRARICVLLAIVAVSLFLQCQNGLAELIQGTASLPPGPDPQSYNIAVERFPTSLGTLTAMHFYHDDVFIVDATSTAVGGTFVPPNYVAGWAFGGTITFEYKGPGFDSIISQHISAGGSFSDPDPVKVANVAIGPTTLHAPDSPVVFPNPFLNNYIAPGPDVPTMFTAVFTPDAGTFNGFAWSGATPVSAQYDAESGSLVHVDYEYATPEPTMLGLVSICGCILYLGPANRRRLDHAA